MPWPTPDYAGGQDDDRTRSIDFVHIEPSIREGVHLVPSLYGPEASLPLYRFPPLWIVPPTILGSPVIPATLSIEFGKAAGSPSPSFEVQWMSNGVDIPGATGSTWDSTVEYDNTVITAEVRAINYLGEDIAITAGLPISIIEPIEVLEFEPYLLTGIGANPALTLLNDNLVIATGTGAEFRLDVNRGVAYYFTGRAAELRNDVVSMFTSVIQGLRVPDRLDAINDDVYVISYEFGEPLVTSVPQVMHLRNPEAEMGLAGWEVFGAVDYQEAPPEPYKNQLYWTGGENVDAGQANIPYSFMHQDVPIWPVWQADVDQGTCNVQINWQQFTSTPDSLESVDQANMKFEFYAADGVTLTGTDDGPGMRASAPVVWLNRFYDTPIPPSTRFIRVFAEFNLISGEDNNAAIDHIQMFIRKGAQLNNRSFGPDFQRWRIRFIQANTYSGTALAQLAFNNSSGVDLATGGAELSGSEGIGGEARFVFDDLPNVGYWAGAQNAVAEDRAWIGYDFLTSVRPQELLITARSGTNSLQVGRQFYIEGSDDGLRWTKVKLVGDYPSFSSQETRSFLIPQGPQSTAESLWNAAGGGALTRDTSFIDDNAVKATRFIATDRLTINSLRVHTQNQIFDYHLGIAKVNTQRSDGMIFEEPIWIPLQTNDGLATWKEHALPDPFTVEVDEQFVIIFIDPDAANNPVDAGEGRMNFFPTDEITTFDPNLDRPGMVMLSNWQNSTDLSPNDYFIGYPGPGNGGGQTYRFGFDFNYEIF